MNNNSPSTSEKSDASISTKSAQQMKPLSHRGNVSFTNRIIVLRAMLTMSLVVAAVVCGVVSYLVLHGKEVTLFESQYNSLADQLIVETEKNFVRINDEVLSTANAFAEFEPDATKWPFVTLPGFHRTYSILSRSSAADTFGFYPIVQPGSEAAAFETFMYDYFATQSDHIDPARVYPFGIWRSNITENAFVTYHDVNGTVEGSDYSFLLPGLQMTYGPYVEPGYQGSNVHAYGPLTSSIDRLVDCVNHHIHHPLFRSTSPSYGSSTARNCTSISDVIPVPHPTPINRNTELENQQAIIFAPIVVQTNATASSSEQLVGLIGGTITWAGLLENVLPTFVTGFDCVVETGANFFTYGIVDGVPEFRGIGDLHDAHFNEYEKSVALKLQGDHENMHHMPNVEYTLHFYPQRSFYDSYMSDVPVEVSCTFAAVIIFCLCVFLVYDTSISRESTRQNTMLDTKRRFVRFISHEIRTPLNTMRLGLNLFEVEMQTISDQMQSTPPGQIPSLVANIMTSWRHLLNDIHENGESAVQVLNDLLNYDKIETGTLKLEFSTVHIWDLIKRTTSLMQIQAKQKEIHHELSIGGESAELSYKGSLQSKPNQLPPSSSHSNKTNAHHTGRGRNTSSVVPSSSASSVDEREQHRDSNALLLPAASDDATIASADTPTVGVAGSNDSGALNDRGGTKARNQYNRDHCVVIGDVTRLGQVLRNLISNALKFTPKSGTVIVTVEWIPGDKQNLSALVPLEKKHLMQQHPRAGSIRISVKDSGAGLSHQQLAEIGAEGVQFNANELQAGQGSGLGLYITKGIVEQHGGKLKISSEGLGCGSVFAVELPIYSPRSESQQQLFCLREEEDLEAPTGRAAVMGGEQGVPLLPVEPQGSPKRQLPPRQLPPIAQSASTSTMISSSTSDNDMAERKSAEISQQSFLPQTHQTSVQTAPPRTGLKHVLVVDDSRFNRKMLCRLLTAKGSTCYQAEDGQQAIDVYRALMDKGESVDTILMDFEMPVMNGPTATRELRKLGCNILIIGVTGNVLPSDVSFFKEHGADAVLPKPLCIEDLEAIVQNYDKPLSPDTSNTLENDKSVPDSVDLSVPAVSAGRQVVGGAGTLPV